MTARRMTYTRPEVAALLGVTERTLVRWHQDGKHFHPWRDPRDPTGRRWLYDRNEVDKLARRRRRHGSGSYRIGSDEPEDDGGTGAPAAPEATDPLISRLETMLREIKKLAGPEAAKNEKPAVAKRPAAREGQVGPTPPTRREPDAADREMDRWEKEIDERKRRWVEAGGDGDPEDANEHEDVPPSSRRIG